MKLYCPLLLATIAAFSSPLLAQKHADKPPFTLLLTSNVPKVNLGTDVWVKIVWTNTSKVEMNDSHLWDDSSGLDYSYTLELRDTDGHPVAQVPHNHRIGLAGSASFGTLKPGDSRDDEINLSRIYNFSHPGDYTLQVSRHVPKELGGCVIKSNEITITIAPRPVPADKSKS